MPKCTRKWNHCLQLKLLLHNLVLLLLVSPHHSSSLLLFTKSVSATQTAVTLLDSKRSNNICMFAFPINASVHVGLRCFPAIVLSQVKMPKERIRDALITLD